MSEKRERRALALEAIGNALLELAALEREPEDVPPTEVLVDRRNCNRELGLHPRSFLAAAGRDFPAFRVGRRVTALRADVLAWLKTRKVEPAARTTSHEPPRDRDAFLEEVNARFEARVGRPMADVELCDADVWLDAGEILHAQTGHDYRATPEEIAARVQAKIGTEPSRHRNWRSLGLDPKDLEWRADELREQLRIERPEMGWREREVAVGHMWDTITQPVELARKAARAAARAARKTRRSTGVRTRS